MLGHPRFSRRQIFPPWLPAPHWAAHRETPSAGFDWQLLWSQWETITCLIGCVRITIQALPTFSELTSPSQLYHFVHHTTGGRCLPEQDLEPPRARGSELLQPSSLMRMDLCWEAHSKRQQNKRFDLEVDSHWSSLWYTVVSESISSPRQAYVTPGTFVSLHEMYLCMHRNSRAWERNTDTEMPAVKKKKKKAAHGDLSQSWELILQFHFQWENTEEALGMWLKVVSEEKAGRRLHGRWMCCVSYPEKELIDRSLTGDGTQVLCRLQINVCIFSI